MTQDNLLPEYFIARHVYQLSTDELGSIRLSDMRVDKARQCYLNPDAFVLSRFSITHPLTISRKTDGYHIYLSDINYRWELQPRDSFSKQWLPVVGVHTRF